MSQFKGKVAAVTGAGSGIGQQLALQLAEQGCHLALADVSEKGLQQTEALIRQAGSAVKVSCHSVDVSDREQVEAFADAVVSEHGAVHMLINNAGVALGARVEDASYEDMHWLMNINYWGVVHGCKAFIPHLRQQSQAIIVNVSSVFGLFSAPMNGVYSASKFAVRGFTDALAQELADSSISVSCAFPAGIKTAIAQSARMQVNASSEETEEQFKGAMEKMFWTTAEQAAAQIIKGARRGRSRILVGKGSGVMDLLVRLLPTNYRRLISL